MDKKVILNLLTAAVISYILFLIYLYFNQSSLMYFPDRNRPDISTVPGWNMEVAKVTTDDGLALEGWYFPPQPQKPVILLLHGNGGSIVHRLGKIQPFIQNGYGVMLAEYRGYGGNPGKPSEQGLYHDARSYITWLAKEKSIRSSEIVLYGESIGSGVAVQMASEQAPKAMILEAAFTGADDIARDIYFYIPVDILMKDRFQSIRKIGKITAPVLFIHGTRDTVIPITSGRKLYEAATQPKEFITIDGAGHNDLYDYNAALHVLDFLSNITKSL